MMHQPVPLTRDVVLVGGGHTHALVLRRWGMKPVPGARLTLINPGPTAPYTGMLPGFVAGHYGRDALEIDLVRLARFAGARLILDRATGLDQDARCITLEGGREIGFDIASIDIGITSDLPDLRGFSDHGVPAKPLGPFASRWTDYLAEDGPAEIAILGAGVGGVELSLAMAHALGHRGRTARISVIDRSTALAGTPPAAAKALRDRLTTLGIALLENVQATAVTDRAVVLSDGREIASTFTVATAGARPQAWLRGTGLDLTDGFITVDPYLRSVSDPAIYATGDCAHLAHAPRPKAGVYAVRAAPILAANLRADLTGSVRRAFKPQGDYLKLISLGAKEAVGERNGITLTGPWVWRWKDRIDRTFMDKLANLPAMATPAFPSDAARGVRDEIGKAPLCGGCGAKVGAGTLGAALEKLAQPSRPDLITGPGDDAAILSMGSARQVITTDHLRAFTEDPWLMGRIAAVHAMGDIWAMGAKPQAALAQITLPRMSDALQARWLDEILAAATDVFSAEGAALAGGHTTMGSELTVGFTVTGLLDRPAITLSGARPGDALILTRPIGSGTILAAEMQLRAKGPDVTLCLDEMARSQGTIAPVLTSANAITDVTGFGLAGHLRAMMHASRTGAEITLAEIPTYAGAEALAADGIRSTLYKANRRAVGIDCGESPREVLLFDPQTAGGLLAAVPEISVKKVLHDIEDMGFSAARIGNVTETPGLTLLD